MLDMQHAWRDEKMYTRLWCEHLKYRAHLGELGIDERIILKLIKKDYYTMV
jgi:hypothetical protein